MPVIAPPTAPGAAPPVPSSTTPEASFDAQLEAWHSYMRDDLQPYATAVAANATDAEGNASAAATAKTAAEQAQAAAESASAATKWVSDTTYAEGVVVWSPADFASYRRKTTGAGTTDPSADSSNWAKLGAGGGALNGAQTLTTSTTLTASSPAVNLLAFTAHGGAITLPNATTMTAGGCKFILDNSAGQFPVGVLNASGQVLGQVQAGDSVQFHLTSAATSAGEWRHSGNLDPVWINNEIMLSLTRPQATASVLTIDATRALIYWRRNDGFPLGRVVTWATPSAVPTVGAEVVLKSASTAVTSISPIGTGRALIRFGDNTCAVLDTGTSAIGTSQAVTFTADTLSRIQVLDAQYAVGLAIDGSGTVVRAKCLDCGASGTTLTVGAEAVSASFTGASPAFIANGGIQLVSSTVIGLTGRTIISSLYYNFWAFALTRTSGTTLSFSANAGTPGSSRSSDTNQNVSDLHPLTASTALLWYWSDTVVRYAVITFASGSATWGTSVASNALTNFNNVTAFAASPDRSRFVAAQCIASSTCNIEAITVSGTTVTVGASTSFSSETAAGTAAIGVLAVTNEGRGVIYWSGQARSTGSSDKIRLFTLSGTAFTFGAEASSTHEGQFGSNVATSFSLQNFQQYTSNNLFSIRAWTSGSPNIGRAILFRVSASATMDVIEEVDVVAPSSFTSRASTGDNLLVMSADPSTGSLAERVWVNTTTKRSFRARVQTYRLASQAHNGQTDWSSQQRNTGLGILSHYNLPGSNAILQTHRIAEV